MWSRFSVNAKNAIAIALQEVVKQGGNQVGPEHILLGIIAQQDSKAAAVLRHLGVLPDTVQAHLRPRLPAVANTGDDAHLLPSAKRVIDAAYAEARRLDSKTINTVHLLIGVMSEANPQRRSLFALVRPKSVSSIAAGVLDALGVTLERVHQAMSELDPNTLLRSSANFLPSETLLRTVTAATTTDESELLRASETETGHQE